MDTKIIDDFSAVRLLINIYMIKKLKSSFRPVNQEKFIESVCTEFKEKNFDYSRKSILFTWKHLLDNYQHYKQNYTTEDAKKMWKYFSIMDNCFDNSKAISEKFNDKWILCLIESLSKYRTIVLKQGPTMDILQAVEDNFQQLGNYDISQKDIYNQWNALKKVYKKYQTSNSKVNKHCSYYNALKKFFENNFNEKPRECVSQSELETAIDSIKTEDFSETEVKKRKIDECNVAGAPIVDKTAAQSQYATFNVVMHDILLQCLKGNKKRIQNANGELDEGTINDVCDEFKQHGYDLTKTSISNEWNDLSCRYELIKNSERPEQWPYFEDVNYIFTSEEMDKIYNADDIANDAESENVKNFLKTKQKVSVNDVKISEKLLNIYECNNKEFLEIKDTLIERNLLREETNYLLNIFVEKFDKRKL